MIESHNGEPPLILLTNDDGFYAEGIEILKRAMETLGEVHIVAPDRERSATSLALTLHHPLRAEAARERVWAVDGTPADCIYLAVQTLLPRRPDLIISGINPGPNLGEQDIAYSGTVAGAFQGSFLGIPSFAVSLLPDGGGGRHFAFAADIAHMLAAALLACPLPGGITLNLNVPPPPIKGIKPAGLGQKHYHPEVVARRDPRGRSYYWIGTGTPRAEGAKESDVFVIHEGYITLTPLHRDLSDAGAQASPGFTKLCEKINHALVQKTV